MVCTEVVRVRNVLLCGAVDSPTQEPLIPDPTAEWWVPAGQRPPDQRHCRRRCLPPFEILQVRSDTRCTAFGWSTATKLCPRCAVLPRRLRHRRIFLFSQGRTRSAVLQYRCYSQWPAPRHPAPKGTLNQLKFQTARISQVNGRNSTRGTVSSTSRRLWVTQSRCWIGRKRPMTGRKFHLRERIKVKSSPSSSSNTCATEVISVSTIPETVP